jgi:phosphoribosylglycinamide formyltransferase-1
MAVAKKSVASSKKNLERAIALACKLPEASCEPLHSHYQFLAKKKTFAYILNNHHGDGILSVCCKLLKGDNQMVIESDPEHCYLPKYIGHQGWVCYRIDVPKIDWEDVEELLKTSYVMCAPKKLAALIERSDM